MVLTAIGERDAPTIPLISEDEIRYLGREGATQGLLEPRESELVHRVVGFTDTLVRAVMVPRPKIPALDGGPRVGRR